MMVCGQITATVCTWSLMATIDRPRSVELVYVDLDGTLTTSDSLAEGVVALIREHPVSLLKLPWWLMRGKAHFKARVASAGALDPSALPYRYDLLSDLQAWRTAGTELVLATAADRRVAASVADHLGLFDSVLSSDGNNNLRGREKLAAIQTHAGGRSYGYVGNARADLPILAAADAAFIAGPNAASLRKRLDDEPPVQIYAGRKSRFADYMRVLRPRQWLKNLLLFVPLIASQQLSDSSSFGRVVVAFVSFSLVASAGYAFNDILDIQADRRHPTKAARPVASGALSINAAAFVSLGLLGFGMAVAAFLPPGFRTALAAYLAVSIAYTVALKSLLLLDVVTLASVFVLRVVAGAEAIEVTTSFWLLAFSLFFFASLALTKRCSELHNLVTGGGDSSHGRAYRIGDLAILQTIGASAGVVSVLVLALYIQDPASEVIYSRPEFLWLLTPLLLYWISRLWIKVGRGEMSEDPVFFALTDAASWAVTVLAAGVILLAT